MSERLSLTLFAHVAGRPEADLDLAEAALLIGEVEGPGQAGGDPQTAGQAGGDPQTPGLDVARHRQALEALVEGARAGVARAGSDEARLERCVRFVYEDSGFRGNEEDYYDPRNSFLHEVIERRTGIPITLAVVLVEVCRRAGVDARGVSFPGHFLVRSDTPRGTIVVNPFIGRPLTREELRALYKRGSGEDKDPPARLLEAATKVQILTRILTNLRGIYESRGDDTRLRRVLERLHVLGPDEALAQQIARMGGSAPWRSGGAGLN